ncbi:MAG: hypothetical protein ABFR75_00970 [Acidobacteriota bacterium]
MPPKKEYGKKEILEAAKKIADRDGIKELSVRKIAGFLGCSTTPIYSSFKSMKNLETKLIKHIIDILISYTEKTYTPNIFLNIGVGIVFFAREHKKLYNILFTQSGKYKKMVERFHEATNIQMKTDKIIEYVSEEDRMDILQKMWIFTHGLSTLVSNGYMDDDSDENIINLLGRTGGDVISSTIFQKNPEVFRELHKKGADK